MKINHVALRYVYHMLDHSDKKRLHKYKLQDNVGVIKDINYFLDNNKFHLFDFLYCKDKWNGMSIFDIHGGIYYYGTKRNNYFYNGTFASYGYKVISLSYRLIDEK